MRKMIALIILFLWIPMGLFACDRRTTATQGESEAVTAEPSSEESTEAAAAMILPDVPQDYWELFDTRCSIVYEPGFMSSHSVSFTLLAAFPVEEVTVKDQNGAEILSFLSLFHGEGAEADVISEDVFLLYQGFDPEEILHAVGANEELWAAQQLYRSIDPTALPALYWYTLEVLTPCEEQEALTEISLTINGSSKTYSIGSIRSRVFEEVEYIYDPEFRLDCSENASYFGYPVDLGVGGAVTLRGLVFTAQSDLTLTGLRFYHGEDITVEEIALTATNAEGISVNSLWDGVTPLPVSAGERICLDIKVVDAFFAEELGGTAARYLLLGYRAEGQDYEVGIPYYLIQRLGQPFLYLAASEGLDVIGYAQALWH